MKANEYFEALKRKLEVETDYALAKKLDIPRQYVAGMRDGSRAMPNYLVMKIAITLELDPSAVLADLELQREKDPKKRAFWDSFVSRVGKVTTVLMLVLVFSAGLGSEVDTLGGCGEMIISAFSIAYNLYYVKFET
jgi:hypothetical protein